MRVAIYCRLSEEDRNKLNKEDDSNSIINQKNMLLQYAMDQKWKIYDIYSDDDYAGADRNRPQFKRLLSDAEERKFDIILCKTQSRFTRELELVEKYIHGLFPFWGIRFISIVDNADTANKGNKKSRQINGLVNEWYLEDMSDNIRSVLTNRRENGFHIGAFAPYGYQKDPDLKGHLIIDSEAAAVVREVFALFADGCGKSAIARILNERGELPPSSYKRKCSQRYQPPNGDRETIWSYASIAGMLKNEVYIGNLVQAKYRSVSYKTKELRPRPKCEWIRVEHTHEAIIDGELWNRVQSRIRKNYKPFGNAGKVHPFSGKVKCQYCGRSMGIHKNHGYYYLSCITRQSAKDACPGAFLPVRELEAIIVYELKRLNEELLDIGELTKQLYFGGNSACKKDNILKNRSLYERKIENLKAAMKQLYIDKAADLLSHADYEEMKRDFLKEKEIVENMVGMCNAEIEAIEKRIAVKDNPSEVIQQYLSFNTLTRLMTETLVHHIEVGRRDKVTGNVPVSVYWNF